MTKRRAKYTLFGMIALMVGSSPWLASVTRNGDPYIDFRAHYLYGLSMGTELVGAEHGTWWLRDRADRVLQGQIVVEYGPLNEFEHGVFSYLRFDTDIGVLRYSDGTGRDHREGYYSLWIYKSEKEAFFDLLERVQVGLKLIGDLELEIEQIGPETIALKAIGDGEKYSFDLEQVFTTDPNAKATLLARVNTREQSAGKRKNAQPPR